MIVTNKGKELMSQMITNTNSMKISKMVFSTHEYNFSDLNTLESIDDIKQSSNNLSVYRSSNNQVNVKTIINNSELQEGYYLKAAGVIVQNEEKEEILYAVGVWDEPPYVSPDTGISNTHIIIEFVFCIENTDNFIIEIAPETVGMEYDIHMLREEKLEKNQKCAPNGLAELDENGLVPEIQLPDIVTTTQRTAIDEIYTQSTGYTDAAIAKIVGQAPEAMDTIYELAALMAQNQDMVDLLNQAVAQKAAQTELDTHTGNNTIHITSSERTKWNGVDDKIAKNLASSTAKRYIAGLSSIGSSSATPNLNANCYMQSGYLYSNGQKVDISQINSDLSKIPKAAGHAYLSKKTTVASGSTILSLSVPMGTYLIVAYCSGAASWFCGETNTDSYLYGVCDHNGTLVKYITLPGETNNITLINLTGSSATYNGGTMMTAFKLD